MAEIHIASADSATQALWREVIELSALLQEQRWTLVGGLMVQLHVYRFDRLIVIRATDDIDVLGDSRQRPSATEAIGAKLGERDYEPATPTGIDEEPVVYRFKNATGLIVDVLGPEGMAIGRPPRAWPGTRTIGIKGGTQALRRSGPVKIRVAEHTGVVQCPTLTAAIILKYQALRIRKTPEDRQDLVALLACVKDPERLRREMSAKERHGLRRVDGHLRIDADDLEGQLGLHDIRRARATFKLLASPEAS